MAKNQGEFLLITHDAKNLLQEVVECRRSALVGMWQSRRDGKAYLRIDSKETIAEGIEGGVGEKTFQLAQKHVDHIALVKEETIRKAVREIAVHENMIVEGSGAAGVAALMENQIKGKKMCVVLTGSNIDAELFAKLL